MSQGNVEMTRRGYEALQRNDIEGFLDFVDPEVEWHSLVLEVEGVRHGHEGVREWWRGLREAFPNWNPSLVNVTSHGDRVVIHTRATGSGAASGVGIDDDFWQVAEIRDGLIVWYRAVRTEREALEAAGLPEEAVPQENVVALIEKVFEAVNARDTDQLMTLVDPEIELHSRLLQVDGRSYRGAEGMERFLREVDEAFEGARWVLDEIIQGSGKGLVVVLRQILRGRASGAPLEVPSFQAWKFRSGRPWSVVVYETREEAFKAAGLSQ